MNNAFEVYKMYLAIKSHFAGTYDYFKYYGKVSAKVETFEKRNDKWFFAKLGKKYNENELLILMVSNFLHNRSYIMNFTDDQGLAIFNEQQKILQSLKYKFRTDIRKLLRQVNSPDDLFRIRDGSNPIILNAAYNGEICIETFCIMNDMSDFFGLFTKMLNDDILWPQYRTKCEKYAPFIYFFTGYVKKEYLNIIKEEINVSVK